MRPPGPSRYPYRSIAGEEPRTRRAAIGEAKPPALRVPRQCARQAARSGPGGFRLLLRRRTRALPDRFPCARPGAIADARALAASFFSRSVSSVSSLAASSRFTIAASQPLRDAKALRNSLIFGKAEISNSVSIRARRGAVNSRNRDRRIATKPPAVMPFCSSPPAKSEKYSENITPFWKHAGPERKAGHQSIAIVDSVLDDHLHPDHEQHRHEHRDIGRRNRPRDRQDNCEHLWQERQRDKQGPNGDADAARSHPGEFGHRNAR